MEDKKDLYDKIKKKKLLNSYRYIIQSNFL